MKSRTIVLKTAPQAEVQKLRLRALTELVALLYPMGDAAESVRVVLPALEAAGWDPRAAAVSLGFKMDDAAWEMWRKWQVLTHSAETGWRALDMLGDLPEGEQLTAVRALLDGLAKSASEPVAELAAQAALAIEPLWGPWGFDPVAKVEEDSP